MWLVLTHCIIAQLSPHLLFQRQRLRKPIYTRTELEIKWQPISNVERGHLLSVSPPRQFAVRPGTFEPSENIWPHNISAFFSFSSLFPHLGSHCSIAPIPCSRVIFIFPRERTRGLEQHLRFLQSGGLEIQGAS